MPVDAIVLERVRAEKARRRAQAARYRDRCELSFIVQSFNRVSNIDRLAAGLRRMGEHELIVCDDGSLDGSRDKWLALLDRPNDFLVLSNDIHEIRILDRAVRFSRSEIVCLVQDDDAIPPDAGWLESALAHFRMYPRLAILGGFMGFGSFHPDPVKARPVWGPAPFQFVHHVNIGPYFVRREHYEDLGGWDYAFSGPGEPGICFDNELCLRAWVKGYSVGYSFVPFKGPPGHYSLDGGTVLFQGDLRRRNQLRNQQRIFEMYFDQTRDIDELVQEANQRIRPAARSAAASRPVGS